MNNMTIHKAVEKLNKEMYIPAIQRRFVWDKEQISMLFDSILRDFPIGEMLVKESSAEIQKEKPTYDFVNNYVMDDVDISQGHHKNPRTDQIKYNPVKLVFDGQQRLTALNIALNGCLYEREKKNQHKIEKNYEKKYFCMNILSDKGERVENPESFDQNKGGDAPVYEFAFVTDEELGREENGSSEDKYWFKVSRILDFSTSGKENDIFSFSRDNFQQKEQRVVSTNLDTLYRAIKDKKCINIKSVSSELTEQEMLEIFIRMNRSGTQITDTDTALSILSYRWQDSTDEIVARDSIESYKRKINSEFRGRRSPINESMILKALIVCSMYEGNEQRISAPRVDIGELASSDSKRSEVMKLVWKKDRFKDSFEKYVDLCRSFGIPTKRVNSVVLFAPILLHIYKNEDLDFNPDKSSGLKNRQRMLYWMCTSTILGVTRTATSRRTDSILMAVKNNSSEYFPLSDISDALEPEISIRIQKDTLEKKDVYENFYNTQYSEFLNILIDIDRISKQRINIETNYHQDHIFPKSRVSDSDMVNRLGNVQYMSEEENKKKSDKKFSNWINSMTDSYRKKHFIPSDSSMYKRDMFENFVEVREDKINRHLMNICKTLMVKNSTVSNYRLD